MRLFVQSEAGSENFAEVSRNLHLAVIHISKEVAVELSSPKWYLMIISFLFHPYSYRVQHCLTNYIPLFDDWPIETIPEDAIYQDGKRASYEA